MDPANSSQWHSPPIPLPHSFPGAVTRTPAQHRTIEDLKKTTPVAMKEASMESSSHIRSNINPFVKQEVANYTVSIPFVDWMHGVTGIPPETLNSWTQTIRQEKWLDNTRIATALRSFCAAPSEAARYAPFTTMANEILELGRTRLAETPAAYPVSDLGFFRNDPHYFQCYEKHGALGARRKPDVVCLRKKVSKNIQPGIGKKAVGAEWPHLLLFAEFKFNKTRDLISLLEKTRTDRGLQRPGPKPRAMAAQKSAKAILSKAGKKRLIADMEEEEVNLPASSKRLNSGSNGNSAAGPEVTVQAASYALEVLSCTNGTRIYSLGLVFRDDRLSLWYYDASGLVQSTEELSLVEDFEKVSAALVGLACSDAEKWGAMPVLRPPRQKAFPKNFPASDLSGFTFDVQLPGDGESAEIRLRESIFCQYALVGRRTFVYAATTTDKHLQNRLGKVFVVKFSQQVESRVSEHHIINIARDAGVKNIPEVFFSNDLWELKDGPRKVFHPQGDRPYDNRILRALVCKKYTPLQVVLLKHPEYLPQMVEEMLDCMHDLRYKANILHRDVSVNNIMCDIQADGTPVFILNDFDLATVVTEQGDSRGATSNHRTGTLPFMADDLVKDMGMNKNTESTLPHRLRHDFQSLFWSTLWCTARIEPVQDGALKAVIEEKTLCWEVGPLQTIGNNKTALLCQNADFDAFPITPKFARYRSYLDRWRIVFGAAVCELNIEMLRIRAGLKQGPLDASLLDRYTTRDMIKERLRGTSVMIEGGDDVSGSIGTQ